MNEHTHDTRPALSAHAHTHEPRNGRYPQSVAGASVQGCHGSPSVITEYVCMFITNIENMYVYSADLYMLLRFSQQFVGNSLQRVCVLCGCA